MTVALAPTRLVFESMGTVVTGVRTRVSGLFHPNMRSGSGALVGKELRER
jgi:hypothetical protein